MPKNELDPIAIELVAVERASRLDSLPARQRRDEILGRMAHDEPWVVRMHVARLLPRLELKGKDYVAALDFLFREAEGANRFVAAWALDALSQLAVADQTIRGKILRMLEEAHETGSPARRARARHGIRRLSS